jgi:hypothetical protein
LKRASGTAIVVCPASTTFPGQRQLLFPTGLIF